MVPRVLIADDDSSTLVLVADAIEKLGWNVTRAGDGDELLDAIAEHGPFDLLITDVQMPWMTGLQVAHSVRIAGVATPVIVMTALPLEARKVEELGRNTVLLRKPFRIAQLVAAARQLLTTPRANGHS